MLNHKANCTIYTCSLCDFKSMKKATLKKHKRKLHRYVDTFSGGKCSICNLRVDPKLFKDHYSTHIELCSKCDFKSVSLVKHMRKHEEVKCNTCLRVVQLVNLTYHQKSMHGIFDMENIFTSVTCVIGGTLLPKD